MRARWSWICALVCGLPAAYAAESDAVGSANPVDQFTDATPIERAQAELFANPPLLYLVVDDAIVESLASINPEAATLILVLATRSRIPEAVPPASGDGGATALSNKSFVAYALQNGFEGSEPLMTPLTPGTHARFNWELVHHDSQVGLLIKHRLINTGLQVIDQPYPDIEAKLRMTAPDHYEITGWSCVSSGPGC